MTILALNQASATFPDPTFITAAIPATTMATPGVPATTVAATNTTNQSYTVTLSSFTMTACIVNGVQVGTTNTSYTVPAFGGISVTYTVAGTWTWVPTQTTVGAPTALGSNTGFTFPNVPTGLVVVYAVIGPSGAGNFVFTGYGGHANLTVAVQNQTSHIIGPFDAAWYSDPNGLVHCTPSVITGNSVGVLILPASYPVATYRATHCPMEQTTGAGDF